MLSTRTSQRMPVKKSYKLFLQNILFVNDIILIWNESNLARSELHLQNHNCAWQLSKSVGWKRNGQQSVLNLKSIWLQMEKCLQRGPYINTWLYYVPCCCSNTCLEVSGKGKLKMTVCVAIISAFSERHKLLLFFSVDS